MSGSRRDLHKARLRRDRIRREKHEAKATPQPRDQQPGDQAPPFINAHPFAMERSMRQMQTLMEGQQFQNVEEANARLATLTAGGRVAEAANAWKRDDPKWRAQEVAYDALEASDQGEILRLVDAALKLDPDCVDARRLWISVTRPPLAGRIMLLRELVAQAEQNMGERFIQEHLGRFWQVISTRPYMRAKLELGELLAEGGDMEGAISVYERMLELNPGDNQGVRYPLLGLYLATGQTEAAARVLANHEGEESLLGSMAWARALQLWLSEDFAEAETALARARKVNPFVEQYLRGTRPIPQYGPDLFRPGDASEAQICARDQAIAWESHPRFREWVGER
jgi:tetratricopeptide (TPR) repeat protein